MTESTSTQYELRFQSLFGAGPGYVFPCDPKGRVDLNQLSDRARNNYLFARAVVGRELAVPAVRLTGVAEGARIRRLSEPHAQQDHQSD